MFKCLFKSEKVRPILIDLIKCYTDLDLTNYYLKDNELSSGNKLIDYRLDIVLVSPDNHHIVNVEMNKEYKPYTVSRNRNYLHRIAGNILETSKDYKELDKYYVEQVNFNNFYCIDNKDIEINTYKLTDNKYNNTIENFKIHNIYIPKVNDLCYNDENQVIRLFTCRTLEELRDVASDNKEMNIIVDEIERLNKEEYFGALYNAQEDFEKRLLSERAEGIEQGIEQGSYNKAIETAKKMKDKNYDILTIMELTSLSKEEIEKL